MKAEGEFRRLAKKNKPKKEKKAKDCNKWGYISFWYQTWDDS